MKVTILESAENDLADGFWFYEHQHSGLGHYFLESLFSDIETLYTTGGIHEIVLGSYHRLISRRFPFGVYYEVAGDEILVHAVFDSRSNPSRIRKRLG